MATKKTLKDDSTDETLVNAALAELKQQLAVVAARREALPEGGFDVDVAAAATGLSKAIVSATNAIRTQRRESRRSIAAVPIDEIIGYLRSLPEHQRLDVSRQIAGSDDLEPLL